MIRTVCAALTYCISDNVVILSSAALLYENCTWESLDKSHLEGHSRSTEM